MINITVNISFLKKQLHEILKIKYIPNKYRSLICQSRHNKLNKQNISMNQQQLTNCFIKQLPEFANKNISFKRVSGLSSFNYAVQVDGAPQYIFKEYIKDKQNQLQQKISMHCSRQEIGAQFIYFSPRFSIQSYLSDSSHPSQEQIASMPLIQTIFKRLQKFHSLQLANAFNNSTLANETFNTDKILQNCSEKNNNGNHNFDLLLQQINTIMKQKQYYQQLLLPKSNQSIKICHNDLNNLNILLRGDSVYLIDYDYAGYNYIGYDIANLINQTSFDYCCEQYPGFQIIKLYTTEELSQITQHYPNYYPQLKYQVLCFMCIVNLYWAIWSIERFEHNVSKTFGILEHGLKRIQLFHYYLKLVLERINSTL